MIEKFNWNHSEAYIKFSNSKRTSTELKTNSFIYAYNSRLIDFFIQDISNSLPYLQELNQNTIEAIHSILLFHNIITIQAFLDSRGFNFNDKIYNDKYQKVIVPGYSLRIFQHEISSPIHDMIIYPYKENDLDFVERNYADVVFTYSYEMLSPSIFILALGKSSSITLEKRILDEEVLHKEQLAYIKGGLMEFKKAEEIFIKMLRYSYSQILIKGDSVTDGKLADGMGLPRTTYRDMMNEKYKLNINKDTGEITHTG